MSWWRALRRRRDDAELDRELRYHVERRIQDYLDDGLTPIEARRRVRFEFGEVELAKDECRDVRPLAWLDDLRRDVRIGFRSLARERMFTASVTLILALGLGASVTMFSILDAVVLRPLPYVRAGELAVISTQLIARNQWDGTSMLNFLDWQQQTRTFSAMTCHRRISVGAVTYVVDGTARRTQESLVCGEFFTMLGTPPLAGRTFTGDEFARGAPVVVLSETMWQEQFGRSDATLGRRLSIAGVDYTIIGVMPRAFHLPTADTGLWRPLSSSPWWRTNQNARDGDGLEVIGRLAAGASIDDARAEMKTIATRLRDAHVENRDVGVTVDSLFDRVVGARTARGVWLGFGAVMSLLLIASANVGGLMLARAARRGREFVVRTALGASRARLVRQLVAEGVCLWALASAAGVAIAAILTEAFIAFGPATLPRREDVTLHVTAVLAGVATGLVVVLGCGTIPAFVAARGRNADAALPTREASRRSHRWQDVLVAAQIGGAVMLLICAVLFARSFLRASNDEAGYPAHVLLIARIDLPSPAYDNPASRIAYFDAAVERVSRLPGVQSVGAAADFFLRRNGDQRVTAEGRALADADGSVPRLTIESVMPGFFRAIGIALIEGREFDRRDLAAGESAVMIVNERLARRLWPGESAVGKRLVSGSAPPADGRWHTVIGVVRDVRREGREQAPILTAYVPTYSRGMDFTIRASPERIASLGPLVSAELRALDGTVPLPQITAVIDRLAIRLGARRFESQALGLFAAIAMLLSTAGLYALLSYQVVRRTREIGIRSALGADRRSIVRMIVGQGLRLAAAGAAAGVAGAVACARLIQSLLYQTKALDPPAYLAVAAFVLLVAAAAALTPALRGASISPTTALRQD